MEGFPEITFEVLAVLHSPRHSQNTPECASVPERIAYDIEKSFGKYIYIYIQ